MTYYQIPDQTPVKYYFSNFMLNMPFLFIQFHHSSGSIFTLIYDDIPTVLFFVHLKKLSKFKNILQINTKFGKKSENWPSIRYRILTIFLKFLTFERYLRKLNLSRVSEIPYLGKILKAGWLEMGLRKSSWTRNGTIVHKG